MKITYIHHSSFLVEGSDFYLLFDYFQGNIPELSEQKPLYVFASHRHGDHFSKVIFELEKVHPNICYILSSDIKPKQVPAEALPVTTFLGKNMVEKIGDIVVETYHSTDEGVAFLVSAGGKNIYHAGDLNDWTWIGEPDDWNAKMRRVYRKIVDGLKDKKIDAAFLPLDGRQEGEFYQGVDYFLRTAADVKAVFPMHFWEDYTVIRQIKEMKESESYRSKIYDIAYEGQEFLIV